MYWGGSADGRPAPWPAGIGPASEGSMTRITIESRGRRHYLRGDTYAVRDRLRAGGCKWDSDARCWYTGKRELADELAAELGGDAGAAPHGQQPRAPGEDATVAGRATYHGRSCYVAGRVRRGATRYDDTVDAITSRDGARMLMYSRDGGMQFWVARDEAEIVKSYVRPQTIGGLRRYAAEIRAAGGDADRVAANRAELSGRCRGCGGPIRDAACHAAMGGYCGSCAFNEYDC